MECDTVLATRMRKISTGSDSTESSEDSNNAPRYELMGFDEMMVATENMDTDVFENTRKFNPRKHRSCHRRSEPVSETKRKEESSKNSREYTKRNRDEIRVCQNQYEDIEAKRKRIQELIAKEFKPEVVEVNVIRAVRVFEEILRRHTAVGDNVREFLNVPAPDGFLEEYRKQAKIAENLTFETGIESYEKKLQELHEQFAALSSTKEALNSQKDKTNYASSKSRLKQRIVRAQLKTYCWQGWNAIMTMRLQGKALKDCADVLKKNIWNNILAIYREILRVVRTNTMNIHDLESLERINKIFAPFSGTSGTLTINWTPREEIKEEEAYNVFEIQGDATPTPPQSTELAKIPKTEKSEIRKELSLTSQPELKLSPSYTLTLPTTPIQLTHTQFLAANTGLTPRIINAHPSPLPKIALNLTPRKIDTLPAVNLRSIGSVDLHDEELIDVEEVTDASRKRNQSSTPEAIPVEEKKPKTDEEDTVTNQKKTGLVVPKTGLVEMQHMAHAYMMHQHLLPPPLLINQLSSAAAQSPGFQTLLPFLQTAVSPEFISAMQHQQQIQKLLHDKFSRIPEK